MFKVMANFMKTLALILAQDVIAMRSSPLALFIDFFKKKCYNKL